MHVEDERTRRAGVMMESCHGEIDRGSLEQSAGPRSMDVLPGTFKEIDR